MFFDAANGGGALPDPMSRRFTRQKFYDLVWSKPPGHIAKECELSGRV